MTGEWTQKMRPRETVEYYLALRKKAIHSNMDKPGDDLAKWISQTEQGRCHIISLICEMQKTIEET